jgi:hypothetical protein
MAVDPVPMKAARKSARAVLDLKWMLDILYRVEVFIASTIVLFFIPLSNFILNYFLDHPLPSCLCTRKEAPPRWAGP